ncbi:hypothetical protein FRX31_022491 [Thalictrum thalictroides]|uniref:Uncharacterized protein n=1 Tax=Thalictrum thalictroides TaxID=46969 RepID=A0A7J6VSP4_THATH|nr:hypothetical protein FRX31_022491 [Thalictrum thalictroides]
MAADLSLVQNQFKKISLQPINVKREAVVSTNNPIDGEPKQLNNVEEECKTPTSVEYKIPMQECPPAPKKSRPMEDLGERKSSEQNYLSVSADDICSLLNQELSNKK